MQSDVQGIRQSAGKSPSKAWLSCWVVLTFLSTEMSVCHGFMGTCWHIVRTVAFSFQVREWVVSERGTCCMYETWSPNSGTRRWSFAKEVIRSGCARSCVAHCAYVWVCKHVEVKGFLHAAAWSPSPEVSTWPWTSQTPESGRAFHYKLPRLGQQKQNSVSGSLMTIIHHLPHSSSWLQWHSVFAHERTNSCCCCSLTLRDLASSRFLFNTSSELFDWDSLEPCWCQILGTITDSHSQPSNSTEHQTGHMYVQSLHYVRIYSLPW